MAAPTVRSFSAEFDPLRLVERHPQCYPGLLDSCAPRGTVSGGGQFDILPISSGETLSLAQSGRLTGRGSGQDDTPGGGFLPALDAWWRSLRIPGGDAILPFSGGWLLYLGYELAREIEPRLRLPASPDALVALAVRAPAAWILDRLNRQAWLIAEPGAEHLLDRFEQHVRELPAVTADPVYEYEIAEDDPETFRRAVGRALDYIAAGEVYQANLSRQWQIRCAERLAPVAIYRRLRAANPGPFSVLLMHGNFCVLSSSPERLVMIRNGRAATRPIAGTRPRGSSPAMDAALIEALLADDKERAEHVMLIDLERNDLGRVCVGGTVQVDEYMSIESYAHVHHIVSNVSGRLRDDVSPVDVIRALFPGGTITGCPKIRCMEIIAELEGTGRGAYTGSIGYLNRDGSCDLNILIRTLSAATAGPGERHETLTFRAGAGIVADSVPARELAETRAKAEGMLRSFISNA